VLLTPRYDGPPILAFDGQADDVLAPLVRQRRRLEQLLAGLDQEQWAAPSRCEGWRVQDVVAHLIVVNAFWATSVRAGRRGEPTRILTGFDPAESPPQLIEGMTGLQPVEVLDRFVASDDGFLAALDGLDAAGWATLAESPPGWVPVRVLCLHALWDCWVHERDIVAPIGLPAVTEDDEVRACARYAAALSPAFAVSRDEPVGDRYGVVTHDPEDAFVLVVGDGVQVCPGPVPEDVPVLAGDAVEVVEALSMRAPLPAGAPEAWRSLRHGGVATAFDAV
jgi:uncharacterized protein (TIGR03083 family)